MENNVGKIAESAKVFTKSPLGIIGLFVVFVYGFASLILMYGKDFVCGTCILIYFLVSFPIVVFFGFLWLVVKHSNKLYGPADYIDEENFVTIQMATMIPLLVATVKQPDSTENVTWFQERLEEIFKTVSKTISKKKRSSSKNRILWVDDNPDNNIYERKAFESMGITFDTKALNTKKALELLNKNDYVAIISDMGRKEGPDEGYVLLENIRELGIDIPFFIYTSTSSQEDQEMVIQKGGQGITHIPDELYKMVMYKIQGF
jgi:CheY-like chemotaxis protein